MKDIHRSKGLRRYGRRGLLALTLLALSGLTMGFSFLKSRFGDEAYWESPPAVLKYDKCSISTGGARFRAIMDGLKSWQNVGNLHNPLAIESGDNDCHCDTEDDESEIIYVAPSEFDGDDAVGEAYPIIRPDGTIKAADVLISIVVSPLAEADPATAFDGGTIRDTIVHEFGHVIGLDHEDDKMSMMVRSSPGPQVPAHPGSIAVLPDDKAGALVHYELGGVVGELNVFVSGQTYLPELPQIYQDAFKALFGDPFNTRVISYNRTRDGSTGSGADWEMFNPGAAACAAFAAAGLPNCVDFDGPFSTFADSNGDRVIRLCPGDAFRVPYGLGSRSDPLDTPVAHQVGLYLGDDSSVVASTQRMLEANERNALTVGLESRVDRLVISDDPDCIIPGDYRIWVVADTCEQLLESTEVIKYSPGSVLEQDNILRTAVRVRVRDPLDPACGGSLPSDGVCDNNGFHSLCLDPPVIPPDTPDYGDCGEADPGAPTARGELGCKCRDLEFFAAVNEDGGFPDGAGSYTEVAPTSPGQFCSGDDVVCGEVGGSAICQQCGTDTNIGCFCFSQSDCEGAEEGLRCWGSEDDGWSPGSRGTCLPDGGTPASRERLTEMPWFCLDGCASIAPSADPAFSGCLYRQAGFNLDHGECVNVAVTASGLVTGQCEESGRRTQTSETVNLNNCFGEPNLPPGDIVCEPECACDEDCPALGFPDEYGCSLFIGTGGTTVGRCVPPECLNPKNDLIGLCQLLL